MVLQVADTIGVCPFEDRLVGRNAPRSARCHAVTLLERWEALIHGLTTVIGDRSPWPVRQRCGPSDAFMVSASLFFT